MAQPGQAGSLVEGLQDGQEGWVSTELSEEKGDKPWDKFRIVPMSPHLASNSEDYENFKVKPDLPSPDKGTCLGRRIECILVNSLWF